MKYLLFSITLLGSGFLFAQNSAKDTPPTKQQSQYQQPVAPILTKEMENYAVDNGSFIIESPSSSGKEVSFDGEVSMKIAQLVDPKKMGFTIIDRKQYFKILDSNKILVVKSTWGLDIEMKNSKK